MEQPHPLVQELQALQKAAEEIADDSDRMAQRLDDAHTRLVAERAQAQQNPELLAAVRDRFRVFIKSIYAERTALRLRAAELAARCPLPLCREQRDRLQYLSEHFGEDW